MAGVRNAVRAVNGRRVVITAVCAVVVLCVLNVWLWRVHDDKAADDATADAAVEVASANVATVLSYSAATVTDDLSRASSLLTGSFKSDFDALGRRTIAPAAKKDRITTSAVVTEIGVVDVVDESEVDLLLFINQTTTSKRSENPTQTGTRIEVTMTLEDGDWLISSLEPV